MIDSGAPGETELIAKAKRAFREHFGREAGFVAIAPGRVNLIGDHVDYAGGLVLPMAIDRWTVAAGDWSADPRRAKLFAVDLDETAELDLAAGFDGHARRLHNAPIGHWSGYIAGVFAELRAVVGGGGVDIAVTSSVPRASGLSSSAALELSVATVLGRAWGLRGSAEELALACQRAEHRGGGVQCGVMDQLASAMGRAGHALLIDCSSLEVTPVPIDAGLRVLVVDTRTPRRLAAGKYDELVERLKRVQAAFDASLHSLTREAIAGATGLDADARASAEHFVDENAHVKEAAGRLAAGDARELAKAMLASHASLRDRLGVSCPELDVVVAAASAVGPEVGARLTGAGMGGCTVVVCPVGKSEAVGNDVRRAFVEAFGRECAVLPVRAVGGARSVL